MDEPIQNPMIRSLKDELGLGGFMCALRKFDTAFFSCRTPKNFEVRMVLRKAGLEVRLITTDNLFEYRWTTGTPQHLARSADVTNHTVTFDLYDPTFDPTKLITDIVELIKLIKAGYKRKKKAGLVRFPRTSLKKIRTLVPKIGRTENA